MMRGLRGILVVVLVGGIAVLALLGVGGCGGGPSSSVEEGPTAVSEEPQEETAPEAIPETTAEIASAEEEDVAPAAAEDIAPLEEPAIEEEPAAEDVPLAEPASFVLTWERQGGAETRCDRMTIALDGAVVAVRCVNGVELETVHATLSEEQAGQVSAWAEQFTPFSRREADFTQTALRTVFDGRGDAAASTEEKAAVARFAKELFLSLTTSS